jgi:hypothetical protein
LQYQKEIGAFDRNAKASTQRAKARKIKILQNINQHLLTYQSDYLNIKKFGHDSPTAAPYHEALLIKNHKLSSLLRLLLGKNDPDLATHLLLYKFEGLTGTFSHMIAIAGDPFTPDHQPNAATLKRASTLTFGPNRDKVFDSNSGMQKRISGKHADKSYTINLHDERHQRGRTWQVAGGIVAENFKNRV